MSKMRLQNLPCFDKRGQQAVTRLFNCLKEAHSYLAKVAKQVIMVSEVSSPEQFTFVLQHAVRPLIQLKIPPYLSALTELKFEKERLTPEELNEENCCNLIRPFHPKFAKHQSPMLSYSCTLFNQKETFQLQNYTVTCCQSFCSSRKETPSCYQRQKIRSGKESIKTQTYHRCQNCRSATIHFER